MMVFHRNLLFQGFIFRFHVSFRACIEKSYFCPGMLDIPQTFWMLISPGFTLGFGCFEGDIRYGKMIVDLRRSLGIIMKEPAKLEDMEYLQGVFAVGGIFIGKTLSSKV